MLRQLWARNTGKLPMRYYGYASLHHDLLRINSPTRSSSGSVRGSKRMINRYRG